MNSTADREDLTVGFVRSSGPQMALPELTAWPESELTSDAHSPVSVAAGGTPAATMTPHSLIARWSCSRRS
jgi:hypothetical protein